jgi:hypothetical protein
VVGHLPCGGVLCVDGCKRPAGNQTRLQIKKSILTR